MKINTREEEVQEGWGFQGRQPDKKQSAGE